MSDELPKAIVENLESLEKQRVRTLKLVPKRGEPEDYAEIRRRSWKCGEIKFQVFLEDRTEGATCRYVHVGVKEEPVYELKCDEETKAKEMA